MAGFLADLSPTRSCRRDWALLNNQESFLGMPTDNIPPGEMMKVSGKSSTTESGLGIQLELVSPIDFGGSEQDYISNEGDICCDGCRCCCCGCYGLRWCPRMNLRSTSNNYANSHSLCHHSHLAIPQNGRSAILSVSRHNWQLGSSSGPQMRRRRRSSGWWPRRAWIDESYLRFPLLPPLPPWSIMDLLAFERSISIIRSG